MKYFKKNIKWIILVIVLMIIVSGVSVYATTTYLASQVNYIKQDGTTVTVSDALNELYTKTTVSAQQVGTITTQGTSYTFQNDGYVLGTIKADYNSASGIIYFNEHDENEFDGGVSIAPYSSNTTFNVRLYAPKGTTLYTRKSYGTYNLTLYEFK